MNGMDPSPSQMPTLHQRPGPDTHEELTLRDIIREVRLWMGIIRRHWLVFLIVGSASGAAGFYYAYRQPPLYTATTRFMIKNEGAGGLFGAQASTLSGLLGTGQMGTPLERTAEVISSDRILGRSLLRTIRVRDTTDLVINHFIRLTGLRQKWHEDTVLNNVSFSSSDLEIAALSLPQRKALKVLKDMIAPEKGVGVIQKSTDKKSGLLTMSCTHRDEDFAIALSQTLFRELSDFFIEQMTYSSNANSLLMKERLDSIQQELNAVRMELARQTDQSLGLLLQRDKVDLKALAVKEQMLAVMYSETLKSVEAYRFVASSAMPSLTIVDFPYAPLPFAAKSKKSYAILFAFVSCLILLLALRFNRFIRPYWDIQST